MNFIFITFFPLASSIIFAAFTIAVYLSNTRKSIKTIFTSLCLATTWWQLSWFVLFNTTNENLASLIATIGHIGIIFLPVWLYHLCLKFTRNNNRLERIILYGAYATTVIFELLLLFTPLIINGVNNYSWAMYPKAGILHPLFIVFVVLMMLMSLRVLYTEYSKASLAAYQEQLQTIFIAILCYNLAAVDFLTNYGVSMYPLGFIFITAFIYFIWRATTQSYLLHIPYFFSYIFGALFIFIYCWSVMVLLMLANLSPLSQENLILNTIIMAFVALVGVWCYEKIKHAIDHALAHHNDPKKLTLSIFNSIHACESREELIETTNQVLRLLFPVDFIYAFKNDPEVIVGEQISPKFPLDLTIASELESKGFYEFKEVITKKILKSQSMPQGNLEQIMDSINDCNVEVVAPLCDSEETTMGCLLFGKKSYQIPYSPEELEVISRITPAFTRKWKELES